MSNVKKRDPMKLGGVEFLNVTEVIILKAQHSENEDHAIWSHHFMGNRWGNSENSGCLYFSGLQNHCRLRQEPQGSSDFRLRSQGPCRLGTGESGLVLG